jgi:hypothetical protein
MRARFPAIVVGLLALGLIPGPASAVTPDVEVTRLEFAAPDIAPGNSVLMRVGVMAQTAQQSVPTFSGLPSGAEVTGPQCERSTCAVRLPAGPSVVDLRLVAWGNPRPRQRHQQLRQLLIIGGAVGATRHFMRIRGRAMQQS